MIKRSREQQQTTKCPTIREHSTQQIHSRDASKEKSLLQPPSTTEQLQRQVTKLRQKAHQSFMQVIQMQQLHEQEIDQLRSEYDQKHQALKKKQAQTQLKYQQFETQLRAQQVELCRLQQNEQNYRFINNNLSNINGNNKPFINVENINNDANKTPDNIRTSSDNFRDRMYCSDSFATPLFGDIESIHCKEYSQLDDSSFSVIHELISDGSSTKDQLIKKIRLVVPKTEDRMHLQHTIDQLFAQLIDLKHQCVALKQHLQQAKKESQQRQQRLKNSKGMIDSLQKELRLTTEQLKAVTQEKTRNQRKLIEKEEHCKLLQGSYNRIEVALNAKGVKIIDLLGKPHFKSVFGGLSEKKKQSDKREDRSFELKESTFSNISVKSRSGLHSAPFHRLPQRLTISTFSKNHPTLD